MKTIFLKLWNLFGGSRIGRRLMAYVFVFSTFLTLVTSAINFTYNYRSEMDELERRFAQIENTFLVNIETALMQDNAAQIEAQMRGLLGLRDIVHAEIQQGEDRPTRTVGTLPKSPIVREFPLVRQKSQAGSNPALIRITASFDQINDRLYEELGRLVLEQIIVIFSLAIFVFLFVREAITRHLVKISDYAKSIDQFQMRPPLELSKSIFLPKAEDELDDVVRSIEEMQLNMQDGYRALIASEDRLKVFAEAASDWLWEMDADLNYAYVSNRFFEITGFHENQVIGKDQSALYEGPADSREWLAHLSELQARKPFRDFTLSLQSPSGVTRWLRISGQPIFSNGQMFEGYRGTGTDITNEVRAREEAIETTLRFLDAIENVSDGIAFWDSQDRFVLCNRIYRDQARDAASLLVRGTPYKDYMRALMATGAINKSPEEQEEWLNQRIKERKEQTAPTEVYREGRWLLIRDGHSSDGSTVSVTTDITEVKQREQQLQQVTDAVPILLAYIDRNLIYQMINKEYESCFAVTRKTIIGTKIDQTLTPEIYDQLQPHIETVLTGKFVRFQLNLPGADNQPQDQSLLRHIDTSFTPDIDRRGAISGFFIAGIDVTDLVQAEETARRGQQALTQQTDILRASFEAMAQGISIWDENDKLIIWNQTFETFMRFPKKYLRRGLSLASATKKAKAIGRTRAGNLLAEASDGIETLLSVDPAVTATVKYDDGQILTGQHYKSKTGGGIFMLTDVTEQTLAQEQLQHSQKIDAIGQLTGGVAHDFNNLLAVIIGSLNLLEGRIEEERSKKLVSSALRASRRGAELTQRLLAFGRRQALMTEHTNANELVSGITDLLTRTLGIGIEVVPKLGNNLWSMDVDRGQLENALLNLAINARDAMPDGGTLTIETANILLGKEYAKHHQDVEPGAFVMISVIDDGVGMSQKVVERAIEPFFTTKKEGAGSGLGLSMIYGFANQSGGHLSIYSEPGHGTVVRIYLPATEGAATYVEPQLEHAGYAGNGEHLLVIEDDADVMLTTTHILHELGYTVTKAVNETEALAVFESGIPIDLVFSDVFLQGSENGPAIVKKIRAIDPDMKILFTSGYTADQFEDANFQEDGMAFIPKPFEASSLAKKLRDILDGVGSP